MKNITTTIVILNKDDDNIDLAEELSKHYEVLIVENGYRKSKKHIRSVKRIWHLDDSSEEIDVLDTAVRYVRSRLAFLITDNTDFNTVQNEIKRNQEVFDKNKTIFFSGDLEDLNHSLILTRAIQLSNGLRNLIWKLKSAS